MLSKKELQEQRVRGYFIDATKELLKSEGLKSVSVRNIADKAGYSFATLYNYFKDVKDLVFLCVKDFRAECMLSVQAATSRMSPGSKRLKAVVLAYIQYFIQYPGIYDLFFNEKLSEIDRTGHTADLVCSLLPELCAADWEALRKENSVAPREITARNAALLYCTTGLLALYLNRRHPDNYEAFVKQAGQVIDLQLKITV
ncbi:TetR/AcrR family transcriptional regulator [Chitinophaga sp. Mgbs1]|uniref:TetR/AcrR family transcriptional regulator n=1 Tax=Chitinophaga solisilvae TaxID=1233460 RepID=A0A9Q5D7B2_9BACT|nr:TetR/AcrR family transcriptional regulator [Chitinophaga solisilvae]